MVIVSGDVDVVVVNDAEEGGGWESEADQGGGRRG